MGSGERKRGDKQEEESENSTKALGRVSRIKNRVRTTREQHSFAFENTAVFNYFAYDHFLKPRWVGGDCDNYFFS